MKIPFLSAESRHIDCGLLLMRIVFGITLFLKHGYEKVTEFPRMSHQFPNLFHLGEPATLTIALISDGICSLLLVLGLATRYAAAFGFLNILVAWIWVHHFSFFGRNGDHGEIIVLFLGALAGFVLTGPGRFSLDYLLLTKKNRI